MTGLLAAHKRIDGIWAANDLMALAALDALAGASRRALVVGANGIAEAVGHIEWGTMLASVDFSPFKIAGIATRAALRHLKGESVPPEIMLPAAVIDRSNCAA
jgi:ribose transport system substrate-binding protein